MSERALPVLVLLALGVVMYQQVKLGAFPPPPRAFVGVALIFSVLAVLSIIAAPLSAALGVAVIVWLLFAYHPGALQGAAK